MTTSFDTIVVGGGLAGLTAALSLAQRGRSVGIAERLPRFGGRCGQFELDGHRFTIGCNDFGSRIVTDLRELGIDVPFTRSANMVALGDASYKLPPGPWTMLRLLPRVPAVMRMVKRVKRGEGVALGDLYPEGERGDFAFHLVSLLAYATGRPTSTIRASELRDDFSKAYAYGHDKSVVPVGGPQVIVDAMLARLRELGATLWPDTELAFARDGDRFVAPGVSARTVIAMDAPAPRGLAVAQLLWETPASAPFVPARALIVSPRDPDGWLGELAAGRWPETYGFHVFRDVATAESVTWTGYVLLPRGVDELAPDVQARLFARVEAEVDRHAPGFVAAIRYRRCLDARAYRAVHGLSSHLSVGAPTLPTEVEPGRYRIGNGAGPPGEHANAAMLSGLWAADRADARLTTCAS